MKKPTLNLYTVGPSEPKCFNYTCFFLKKKMLILSNDSQFWQFCLEKWKTKLEIGDVVTKYYSDVNARLMCCVTQRKNINSVFNGFVDRQLWTVKIKIKITNCSFFWMMIFFLICTYFKLTISQLQLGFLSIKQRNNFDLQCIVKS